MNRITDNGSRKAFAPPLDGLPDHYRDAVRLHYLDELSYDEIASVTGRQTATVRAHARRGLLRLREDLVPEPGS